MKTILYTQKTQQKRPLRKSPTANKNNFKIYRIVWRDAFTEVDEWHDDTSLTETDYLCETVGYLIENNSKQNYYTIASTITQDSYYCSLINIPKDMVVKKQRLHIQT